MAEVEIKKENLVYEKPKLITDNVIEGSLCKEFC